MIKLEDKIKVRAKGSQDEFAEQDDIMVGIAQNYNEDTDLYEVEGVFYLNGVEVEAEIKFLDAYCINELELIRNLSFLSAIPLEDYITERYDQKALQALTKYGIKNTIQQ